MPEPTADEPLVITERAGWGVRLSRLAAERPEWIEVDLNPVIATPAGATIVDGLVVTAAVDA